MQTATIFETMLSFFIRTSGEFRKTWCTFIRCNVYSGNTSSWSRDPLPPSSALQTGKRMLKISVDTKQKIWVFKNANQNHKISVALNGQCRGFSCPGPSIIIMILKHSMQISGSNIFTSNGQLRFFNGLQLSQCFQQTTLFKDQKYQEI